VNLRHFLSWCFLLASLFPPLHAADLKVEVFYRGLLSTNPVSWATMMETESIQADFPFDQKFGEPPSPIPVAVGTHFGSLVRLTGIPNDLTTLNIRTVFRHPSVTGPDGQVVSQRVRQVEMPVQANTLSLVLDMVVEEPWQAVPGPWSLQAYIDDTLFYAQRFVLLKVPPLPAVELSAAAADQLVARVIADYRAELRQSEQSQVAADDWAWIEAAINRDWDRAIRHARIAAERESRAGLRFEKNYRFLLQKGSQDLVEHLQALVETIPSNALVVVGSDTALAGVSLAVDTGRRPDLLTLDGRVLVNPAARRELRLRPALSALLPAEEDIRALMVAYAEEFLGEDLVPDDVEFVGQRHVMELNGRILQAVAAQSNTQLFVIGGRYTESLLQQLSPHGLIWQFGAAKSVGENWAQTEANSWKTLLNGNIAPQSPITRLVFAQMRRLGHDIRLAQAENTTESTLQLHQLRPETRAEDIPGSYLALRIN